MLKKSITYESFDGAEKVTEDFYFNLTTPELFKLDAMYDNDLSGAIKRVIDENDTHKLVSIFEDIIKMAYGVRQENSFYKSEDLTERFIVSPAYDSLFLELFQNPDSMTEFITAISPKIK